MASLEEQNKILTEVLKASRDMDGKGKERNSSQNPVSLGNSGETGRAEKKRKNEQASPSQTKKARVENSTEKTGNDPANKKGQILEYPDYEANKEDDFDEGRSGFNTKGDGLELAGNQTTPSEDGRHGVNTWLVPRKKTTLKILKIPMIT